MSISWTRPVDMDSPGHDYRGAEMEHVLDTIDALVVYHNALVAAYTSITLSGGWTNRASYPTARYRKINADTALLMILNITGGTVTNGTTIFTLPSGDRPAGIVQIPIITRIASTPQTMGALEITTDGAAKIYDIGSSTNIHTVGIVPLDAS